MGPRSTGGASPARPEGQRGRQHTEGLGRSRVRAPALTPPLVQSPRWRLRAALDVALRGAGRASPSRAGCNKHAPCHQARPALLCLPTCLCCLSRWLPPAATLPRSGLSPVPALLGRSRAGCEQPPGFFSASPEVRAHPAPPCGVPTCFGSALQPVPGGLGTALGSPPSGWPGPCSPSLPSVVARVKCVLRPV